MELNNDITWHHRKVLRKDRMSLVKGQNKLIWFTGLSGSGKSTLAIELERRLYEGGFLVYLLDGDNIRHGLNRDLGFSKSDREENIRRISEVSKLFFDSGIFVITSFISPFKKERDSARKLVGDENFIEVFVDCPLEECERRDTKGLYKKARAGLINDFTGVSQEYEAPENPDLVLNTNELNVEGCVDRLIDYLGL
jgi:adenylylsulfate kinase